MVERKPNGVLPVDTREVRKCGICGEGTDRNAWICAFCQQQFAEEEEAELRDWESRQEAGRQR